MPPQRPRPRKKVVFVLSDPSGTNEPVVLRDSSAMQAMADPLRIQILRLLATPKSAKELADAVSRPVTSLYHHLDLLEEHGLIEVADVRREGRSVVRRYVRVSDRFEPLSEVMELGALVTRLDPELTRRQVRLVKDIATAVTSALDEDRRSEKRIRMLLRGPIDPDRLDALAERVQDTLQEFFDDENGTPFEVVMTVAPSTRPDAETKKKEKKQS